MKLSPNFSEIFGSNFKNMCAKFRMNTWLKFERVYPRVAHAEADMESCGVPVPFGFPPVLEAPILKAAERGWDPVGNPSTWNKRTGPSQATGRSRLQRLDAWASMRFPGRHPDRLLMRDLNS